MENQAHFAVLSGGWGVVGKRRGEGEHESDSATFHIDDLNLGSLDIDCGWFFLGYV